MKKYIKILSTSLALAMGVICTNSCDDSQDLVTKNAEEGGILIASSKSLNYVVGNPGPYKIEFFTKQAAPITSIKLYKQFTTSTTYMKGEEERDTTFVSNEVLAKTITVKGDANQYPSVDLMYTDLISDLTVANLEGTGPISANDGDLSIGDNWKFRVVAVLADGREVSQNYSISVTVSTRYAGTYKIVSSEYYRLDVPRPDVAWPSVMIIESVNATTYRQATYFGPFDSSASKNELYFVINGTTITYPDKKPNGDDQNGNGNALVTCVGSPGNMIHVHCDESNIVINDDVKGKDRLIMSYGYFTAGSGPRTMYQVLEKVVD